MPQEVKLVPYEPHMGPNFVPYEVIEAALEAPAATQPKQDEGVETPAPVQPK